MSTEAGTGTDVTGAFKRKLALFSARLESYLTTHAFEILFLAMFALMNVLMYIWGAHDEFHHIRTTVEVQHPTWTKFKWYIAVARGAGFTLNINCAIIIIVASRLFLTALRDTPLHTVLPLDKSFPAAHIIVGYTILGAVVFHAIAHCLWIFTYNQLSGNRFTWFSFSFSFATGIALTIVFGIMFGTAVPWMRRTRFRTFYVIHLVGAALFFVLVLLHGSKRTIPEVYKYIVPALIIYGADRIIRRLRIATSVLQLSGAHYMMKPGRVIELRVRKPFRYRAGQYAEIRVPSISREYHPFTIASAPHEETMCFYIKVNGNWTEQLYDAFEQRVSDPTIEALTVMVRGPFGAPAQHAKGSYKRVVLISGGIGSTPFAAVCKDLHYRNVNAECERLNHHKGIDHVFNDRKVYNRMCATVDSLYDLRIDGKHAHEQLKLQNARYFTNTMKLQAATSGSFNELGNAHQASAFSSDGYQSVFDMEEGTDGPRRFMQLRQWRARALAFLHTTRVMLVLLLSLLLRFALVCIVAIWQMGDFGFWQTQLKPQAYWTLVADTVLGLFLTVVIMLTIALEISYLRKKYFDRFSRCVDFFVFLPLTIISTALRFQSWYDSTARGALTGYHFGIMLPLLFGLLSHRMYRSVGSQSLLDYGRVECACKCGSNTPDVDFVWTTPKAEEDLWLREELQPLAAGTELRLHRYVTREQSVEPENHIHASAGRPDWQTLFSAISDGMRSGSEVGVFFCGPPKMGDAIKSALSFVQVRSNLRGAYLATLSDNQVAWEFSAKNPEDVQRLRQFGCNVRFVFREENF